MRTILMTLAAAILALVTVAGCQPTSAPTAAPVPVTEAETRGYVHDTSVAQWIAPWTISNSAGTWTATMNGNVVTFNRAAADAAWNAFAPVPVPSNGAASKGAYLQSVDIWYSITVSDCDDFATVALEKLTVAGTAVTPTATAPTIALDTGHDTAAERKAIGEHKMTITLSTPAWVDHEESYAVYLAVDAASGTVFKWYGARANYTLRL
jgi:hypothetical protein